MLRWILGLSWLFVSQVVCASQLNNILMAEYLKKKKTFIFSPVSLEVALSMTAEGASGNTLTQFEKLLGLPNAELYKKLNFKSSDYEFISAQKVWIQKDYMILPLFEKSLKEDYQSSLEKADFKNDYLKMVPVINKWVSEKTKDKIKDLIPKDGLTEWTRLVLVNAAYFNAKWLNEFDASRTRESLFKTTAQSKETVQMMSHDFSSLKYFEAKNFLTIVLPYVGDDLSFHVFLPKKVGGEFDKDFLKSLQEIKDSDYKDMNVFVKLPKFSTEYTADVKNYLEAAGIKLPFDEKKADFSKISLTVKKSKEDVLYINNIFQKAFIEVGEKGTEAAAATAVVVQIRGTGPPPSKPKEFIADHPFLYFIKQKDQIFFAGYFAGNK